MTDDFLGPYAFLQWLSKLSRDDLADQTLFELMQANAAWASEKDQMADPYSICVPDEEQEIFVAPPDTPDTPDTQQPLKRMRATVGIDLQASCMNLGEQE
jgi:hypothetical protein